MQKRFKFMIIFLGFLICITYVVINNKLATIKNHSQFLKNGYERSFYETVNYLNDVDNLLVKVQLTKLARQNINMFAQIWRSSSSAHNNLSNLPYNHNLVSRTLKYLSQISDFSYAMMNKSIDNENLSEAEWKTLSDLQIHAANLSSEMNTILTNSNVSEKIDWDKLATENLSGTAVNLSGSMKNVSKQFQEYGELIYDGPFSDHIQNINPKMLKGKAEINKIDGLEKAKKILANCDIKNIEYTGETTTKKSMTAYSFTAQNNNDEQIYLEITKRGAFPLLMITEPPKNIFDNKIDTQKAIGIAKKFLTQNNFLNMKESYYEQFENFLTINFAPCDENIIMYPDLVKIKVDLSTQKISGFETLGYLTMHCEREKKSLGLSEQFIDDLLPIGFEKISAKRCIVPLDSKKEVLCCELTGNFNGNKFIIYVNEESGKFEKIYRLIENERGTLAE